MFNAGCRLSDPLCRLVSCSRCTCHVPKTHPVMVRTFKLAVIGASLIHSCSTTAFKLAQEVGVLLLPHTPVSLSIWFGLLFCFDG